MHNHKHKQEPQNPPRAPLWKWIVIIVLVIAMPLFFSFYRSWQLQNAIAETNTKVQHTP